MNEPTGKMHCGESGACDVGAYSEDRCECGCSRCAPWNDWRDQQEREAREREAVAERKVVITLTPKTEGAWEQLVAILREEAAAGRLVVTVCGIELPNPVQEDEAS